MGRKPLGTEAKTDRPLRIRLTDAERESLDSAAESAGLPTATWARDRLLKIAEQSDATERQSSRRSKRKRSG